MKYKKANTDWMAESKFGISTHWSVKTMPQKGENRSFAEAVENFDVKRFIGQIGESGADYLIFTTTHMGGYYFPGPVKAVEKIIPSRAMKRDLIGEIAQAMKKQGKRFILYYNLRSDPEWETAMGYYHPSSFEPFIENLCSVVGGISGHYAGLLDGWWFDCGYCVDTRGAAGATAPFLEGKKYEFPWDKLTVAAKKGGNNILVAYASGMSQCAPEDDCIYTEHQDYWDGERNITTGDEIYPLTKVLLVPTGRRLFNGLQWHQWTCLDNRAWNHILKDTAAHDPLYTEDEVYEFIKICGEKKAAITFNVEIFQEGLISDKAINFLSRISRRL